MKATTLKTDVDCALSVKSGRKDFDGWLSSSTTVAQAIKDGTPMVKVGDPVFYEPLAVATDKTGPAHAELQAALDQIVKDMHADGTLTAFSKKWFEGQDLTTKAVSPTPRRGTGTSRGVPVFVFLRIRKDGVMAANVTLAAPEVEPPILGQIRKAQRSARDAFRFKFVLTWAVILGVVAVAIVATGNADPEFTGKWTVYILGGTGLTILISVVSITLATVLAVLGALGRLSRNGYINGVASLYVSLVRGTPLLVQIYSSSSPCRRWGSSWT